MSIAPETKSADPAADASRAFDEFARAFEAFKDTNDSRLARIETRLSGDVVTEEKLARIDDALDEHKRRIDRVALDARRPALAGAAADARDPAVAEHKAAFDALCPGRRSRRAEAPRGEGAVGRLRAGRRLSRARRRSSARCCGGLRRSRRSAPSPACARSRADVYKQPFSTAGAGGRLGRRDRGAAADRRRRRSPSSRFPAMELYAMPAATADAARRRRRRHRRSGSPTRSRPAFAEQEGAAFVNGDGVNKPKGFLAYDHGRQRRPGRGASIGYRRRPAPPAPSRPCNPSDVLVDLVYALKAGYRQNGVLRDEPQDAGRDPQVQGRRRQLSLAAAGAGRPAARR